MPTTFKTGAAELGRGFKPFPDGTVGVRKQTYSLTAALTVNDVIQMIPVYAGEMVVELRLICDDLDTGTALVLDVGDGDDVDRYIDGTTIGQTGGTVAMGSGITTAKTMGHVYTADDTIDVLVAVAPGTGATSGTITLIALIA
jgi:hypothetical protein